MFNDLIEEDNIKKEQKNIDSFKDINLMKFPDVIETFVDVIFKKNPLYYDISKMWYLWDDNTKKWNMIDKTDVVNIAKSGFGAIGLNTNNIRTQFCNAITDKSRLKKPKELDRYKVQFKDRFWDIKTNKIEKVTSSYFAFNPIPHNVGDSEETPIIDEIFEQWVGKDKIKLYELCAYCLLPDYPFARFWVLIGAGSNGKSTFFDFLTKFLGNYNICGSDLELLFNNQFETSKLYKKLACIIGESDYSSVKNGKKIKNITGNDPTIRFEFKGKDGFTGKSYAKIIISTNQLPETMDKTDGYYRRFIDIMFPNQFPEKYDILARITEQEYENFAKKCLNILKRLLNEAKFTDEGTIEEKATRYEKLSNPFEEFKTKHLVEDYTGFIEFNALFTSYSVFLKENKHNKISYNSFSSILRSNGYKVERKNFIVESVSRLYYNSVDDVPNYSTDDWRNQRLFRDKKTVIDGFRLIETRETRETPISKSEYRTQETDLNKTLSQREVVSQNVQVVSQTPFIYKEEDLRDERIAKSEEEFFKWRKTGSRGF